MKNLIAALLCLAVLSGCKKDSESAQTSILGQWTLKKTSIRFYSNDVFNSTKDSLETTSNKTVQFNNDGTGYSNIRQDYTDEFGLPKSVSGAFIYKISGSSLIQSYSAYTITQLSKTFNFTDGQLVIHHDYSYNVILYTNQQTTLKQSIDEYFSK